MKRPADPVNMPLTHETPAERLMHAVPLFDTAGQQYVEKRGITAAVSHKAGIRFDVSWHGRPAVIAPMINRTSELCSVHGRYLSTIGKQNKMFTIGAGGGVFAAGNAWTDEAVMLVEGVFDALSLSMCGCSSMATVGRLAPWLPEFCYGRLVILAFDGNQPGDAETIFYKNFLVGARCRRITPPLRCKDWNTALSRYGQQGIKQWLRKICPETIIRDYGQQPLQRL